MFSFEYITQYGWREAISWKQDNMLWVFFFLLTKEGLKIYDTEIAFFVFLDIVHIVEV